MKLIPVAVALALATPAAALHAQYVSGGIVVQSGPVSAHVVIAPRPYYPAPRVLVVHPYPQRVIVVEGTHHRGRGYWRHHGYRPVTVWYDQYRDCYYPYADARFPGLRQVDVYERGGSYYRDDQDRNDRGWDDGARDERGHSGHSSWERDGR